MTRWCVLVFILAWLAWPVIAAPKQAVVHGHYAQRPAGKALLARLSDNDTVDIETARRLLADAVYQPTIVAAMRRPAEKTLTWADYRPIFVQPERAAQGAAYIEQHRALFDKAQSQYGVPAALIAAIIGVETKYGQVLGDNRVLDALATLAFDYPERSDYFTRELGHFIRLCAQEDLRCDKEIGSYAGAMGLPQFMPSSYRAYAVDANQDGKRDLWTQPADIIASVANYLAEHGWQRDHGVALPATLAEDNDIDAIVRSRLEPAYRWDALQRLGIHTSAALADHADVGLLELTGAGGTEYWLGLNNFFVITRYNHSPLYAMAVYQLSQRIDQRMNQDSDNPRGRPTRS